MSAHEIHWDVDSRSFIIVHNHEMKPGTQHGWVGTDITEDEYEALLKFSADEDLINDGFDLDEYLESIDIPIQMGEAWYGISNGSIYKVTSWCSLAEMNEWGMLKDDMDLARWTGPDGVTIPLVAVTGWEYDEGPMVTEIGPIGEGS